MLGRMRRARREDREHVLDMDHADDRIELVAIDRHPAVPGFREQLDEIGEAGGFLHGDDVRARHADIARVALAEMEQILEHLALDRGEIAGGRLAAFVLMLVDRFLDAVAQRLFLLVAEQQGADFPPYAAAFVGGLMGAGTMSGTGALGHVRVQSSRTGYGSCRPRLASAARSISSIASASASPIWS